MYTIYIDDDLLYAPNMAEDGYTVLEPKVKLALNSAASLECRIPTNNPLYGAISKLKSVVKVYDGDTRIFRGKVIDDKTDFYNRQTLTAQGELAYLNDSILRPYTYTGTVAGYFEMLITQHNEQVDEEKQFTLGEVTVEDSNDYITRSNTEATKTWSEMKSKLLDLLGGYIIPRYEVVDGEEVNYLDYLADSGGQNGQSIVFAENLLDMENYVDASEVYTVLVPYGAADSDTGVRVDITDVNDGYDYIESETGISLYGRVVGTEKWDDVTDADNLLAKAESALENAILMSTTLTIKAVDLHRLGTDTDAITLGEYNRVVSSPHNVDSYFQCSGITLRLDKIDNSEFSFGATGTTLTQYNAKNGVNTTAAAIAASVATTTANSTASALNLALTEIASDYCTVEQYEALEARVTALENA